MKVKGNRTISTAEILETMVNKSFNRAVDTQLANDLLSVERDPQAKGKGIIFRVRKSTFKLSDNIRVKERDFTGVFSYTDAAMEIENIIKNANAPAPVESMKETPAPVTTETPATIPV